MRHSGRLTFAWVALGVVSIAGPGAWPQAKPQVPDVLRAAARYLDAYDTQLSAITCEERYRQTETVGSRITASRDLRSDLTLVNFGAGQWLDFRDVFQVDGQSVRDHQARILDLFLHPMADTLTQAKRLADESARFNLGHIRRTINIPTFALAFLTRDNQRRSTFVVDSAKTTNDITTAVLRFTERERPRLIGSEDDAAATGRFWIDVDSGRVSQSELLLSSLGADARILVKYAADQGVGMWVPFSMDEWYDGVPMMERAGSNLPGSVIGGSAGQARESNEGHATYANFRASKVEVSVIIR